MAGNVAEFTDAGFKTDVISSSQPVVVDFWGSLVRPLQDVGPHD